MFSPQYINYNGNEYWIIQKYLINIHSVENESDWR
jgi:hypothetical protein